jgi:hypothetical protein
MNAQVNFPSNFSESSNYSLIRFFTFSILMCHFIFSFGQRIQFELITGTNKYDDAKCIIQTLDSGYAVVGSTSSFGGGQSDIYLTKISKKGLVVWQHVIGGAGIEKGNSLIQTPDSGFTITGYSNSEGVGGYDVHLAKTNKNGLLEWSNTYGGGDWDFGNSIIQTTTGDYVICGSTYSYGKGNSDVYLLKLNSKGLLLWDSAYGGLLEDVGNSVSESKDGGYFITGYTKSFGKGNEDVYLLKTDVDGNLKWTQTYGGALEEKGNEGKPTTDGGYIVISQEKSFSPTSHYENWLLKTDALGDTVWSRRDSQNYNRISTSVCQTVDGGYIFTGHLDKDSNYDMFLYKTNSGGGWMNIGVYGGTGKENAFTVKQTFDSGYVVAGVTETYGVGTPNIYVLKTNDSLKSTGKIVVVVSVDEHKLFSDNISLYPNPASDYVTIKADRKATLEILDPLGRIVSISSITIGENNISVTDLPDGMYFVQIYNSENFFSGKIIVRH